MFAKISSQDVKLSNSFLGGYVYVDELLERSDLQQYSVSDVEEVVRTSDKQRFKIDTENGRLKIKATQGHSKKVRLTTLLSRDQKQTY